MKRFTVVFNCLVSSTNTVLSFAFLSVTNMRFKSNGFSIKSNAPFLIACTAVSIFPWPLIMIIGESTFALFKASNTSIPSICGILISQKMTSYNLFVAFSTPSFPCSASSTSNPSNSKISRNALLIARSSSTISILAIFISLG